MSTALGLPRFIRIEGYNDNESFTSRYGPSFRGKSSTEWWTFREIRRLTLSIGLSS